MKYLKKFNESRTTITEKMIEDLFAIDGVVIHPDGTIDSHSESDVCLNLAFSPGTQFDQTKIPFKFGYVKSGFVYNGQVHEGPKITSLEGSPETCGYFSFGGAALTDLKGAPKYVIDGSFSLNFMGDLTSLEGGPIEVSADYECPATGITSLKGVPKIINGDLYCRYTKIRDLKGGPEIVKGSLIVSDCNLTSLEGLPKEIGLGLVFSSDLVWNPAPLRDVKIGLHIKGGGLIRHLLLFFFLIHRQPHLHMLWGTGNLAYQRFIESLDYNWVKGTAEDPKIDLFRFKEAMNEFDIDIDRMVENMKDYHLSIGPYQFVDLQGRRVSIFGNLINME